MSLKTFLGKKLVKIGRSLLEQKQRVSAATAYTAPIKITYHDGESIKHVGTHYLPFDEKSKVQTHKSIQPVSSKESIKFRKYGKSPRDINKFYHACGGYPIFSKILRHQQWYTVNQRSNDSKFPYVLIVLDRDNVSKNGNPESRSFRVKSYEDGHKFAQTLAYIHALNISKRIN